MSLPERTSGSRPEPAVLQDRALAELRYIRETMERAGSFTLVPGRGLVLVGVSALGAAFLAGRETDPRIWIALWLVELALALAIAIVAVRRKARAGGQTGGSGPARRFALAFAVPALVAGFLTLALVRVDAFALLPGLWLLLYGVALLAGWGSLSREIVPRMGLSFKALGALALFAPREFASAFMGLGFGVLHIVFGFLFARR